MPQQILEADWKIWKPLFEVALDRFCQRTLLGAAKYATAKGTAHERYLDLYQYVKRRDKELAKVFDHFSRSKALVQIALAAKKKLITPEELAAFSPETQQIVELMLGGADA
ncbi:MAG: peptide ABC transporter substrate-binding protein [Acidobacteria bacterium]|nr:peptide ABC transporter substrate-binding protein [Acidobacteriota bacterium]MBI3657565.1 peptide ABC transporter substrate-binding protein [Acidobacteriota bacterium]